MVLNGQGILYSVQDKLRYMTEINKLLDASSTVMIEANMAADTRMAVSVELTNLSTQALGNVRLYAVVYEDLGISHNHYLVKDIQSVPLFTLAGRSTATFDLASDVLTSPARHMVILLKSTSGVILQALFVK